MNESGGPDSAPTPLDEALTRLAEAVTPVDRTERVPVTSAVGRVLATGVPQGHDDSGRRSEADEPILPAGRRLRRSDLGVCRTVGTSRVEVRARPTVGVLPVAHEPPDGGSAGSEPPASRADETTVDASGLTVSALVEAWGGKPTVREPVVWDEHTLRTAVQRDLTKDLLVTVGGTADDERAPLAGVVDSLGSVLVNGVGLDPGGAVAVGLVRDTPVLALPASPVASLATAVQVARPAVKRLGQLPSTDHPTVRATIVEDLSSDPERTTVHPVALDRDRSRQDEGSEGADRDGRVTPSATPLSTADRAPTAIIASADGWVTVSAGSSGPFAGETVTVADWEYQL